MHETGSAFYTCPDPTVNESSRAQASRKLLDTCYGQGIIRIHSAPTVANFGTTLLSLTASSTHDKKNLSKHLPLAPMVRTVPTVPAVRLARPPPTPRSTDAGSAKSDVEGRKEKVVQQPM
ncbi:hypothetical protein PSPO01_07617 [Paraphaeosphaeria sporulosa]